MDDTGAEWAVAKNRCIYCGDSDFTTEFGPRTFIDCVGCNDLGTHLECEHAASGVVLDEETVESENYAWYCSKVTTSGRSSVQRILCAARYMLSNSSIMTALVREPGS